MASSTVEQLCRQFSLAEIQSATEDFSDAHVIGNGGFGKVYKGVIDNGSLTVAIKRLGSNSNQGEREFAMEMQTLSRFRHRNLVSLIGYCSEQGEMILVYDYMPNGTLADQLLRNSSSLSWTQRLKICIGAGRGLDYLHSGCSIVHRDVKSTNILLDDNFTARVSDFGLAKHLGRDMLESHVSVSIKGSFGYFDPNYFTTGRLTKASDTYAFGVVLLEVLSGRPAVDRTLGEDDLCMSMWAREKIRSGKVFQIVASNLKGEISEGCLKTFVGVVKRCLRYEPKKRLTMTRAVAQLEFALEQQERKGKLQFGGLRALWDRVVPSGSTPSTPATEEEEEDALENKQIVDMHTIAASALRVDHTVDMLPIYVPTIPAVVLKEITDDFNRAYLIAEGYNGDLTFHGVLKTGQDVAIKKLSENLPRHKFMAEVSAVSNLKHGNVVELLGYCLDGDLQVFVYEFAPRGSLHDILHGRQAIKSLELDSGPALSWRQRVKIAVDVARGLCYIHDKQQLIHCTIRSNNVLLFDDEIAKIMNLHTSTQCSCRASYRGLFYPDEPHPFTHVSLNREYRPPECNQTQKGNVYSFGILLLELLTGEKPFDCIQGSGQEYLVPWAKQQIGSNKVHKIVDARLKADYPLKAVKKMAEVAQLCLQFKAASRPDMITVLRALQIASQER